ncbi:hypothetical protein ACHAXM_001291, partial [Skeletonema potamos]
MSSHNHLWKTMKNSVLNTIKEAILNQQRNLPCCSHHHEEYIQVAASYLHR